MSLLVLKPAISITVVGPAPSQCRCSRAPCTGTSPSTRVVGRGIVVDVVVEVDVDVVVEVDVDVVVEVDVGPAVVRTGATVMAVLVASWVVSRGALLVESPQAAS